MAGRRDIEAGRAYVLLFLKNEIERGLLKASSQMKAFASSVNTIATSMTTVGTRMAGLGMAIGTPIALATQRFAQFDDAMRTVRAVSQGTDAEFAALTETAKRLGASTSFTAVEVANLMTELGRAGFSPQEIDQMTGAVLNLARATGTDATLSAGIMSASLRQFHMGAAEATRVADALTVAANMSFNSVESLGESLEYAGPVAASFGMSIEDTLAILGGLGNVGIQGSEAGTALRRLLSITAADAKGLKKIFGVEFLDAAGNARPLVDTLAEVNAATAEMASGERAAKFKEAFGLLGITAANAIGSAVTDIRSLREALGSADGAAADAARQMDAGLGGSIRILLSAVEGVAIGIGEALAPRLQELAAWLTDVSGKVLAWVKDNQNLAITLAAVAVGLVAGGGALMGFGAALTALSAVASFASTVLGILAGAVGLLSSPIVLVVGALAAWGAAFAYVTGLVDFVTTQLGGLWNALTTIASLLGGGEWGKAWDVAVALLTVFGSTAMDIFSQLPELIGYAMGRTARAIVEILGSALDWAANAFYDTFVGICKLVSQIPQMIGALLRGDTGAIGSIISSVFSGIGRASEKFGAGLGAGWSKSGQALTASARTVEARSALTAMTTRKPSTAAPAVMPAAAARAAGVGGRVVPTGVAQTGPEPLSDAQQELRDSVLKSQTPLEEYQAKLVKLYEALQANAITAPEFAREVKAAQDELSDPSPVEKYTARVKELQELYASGLIDEKKLQTELKEALPQGVEQALEKSKTPMQKFREEIARLLEYQQAGMLTDQQFAAAYKQTAKEYLPKVTYKAEGGTFSAIGALAGIGGKFGRADEQTAENTAVMRRYMGELVRLAKSGEGMAFA
jgi:TP901 family phage tail tape measure protein